MAIPQKLIYEIAEAEKMISSDGELPAAKRKHLLQLIEEQSVAEHANAGYLRRARLALICASAVVEYAQSFPEVFNAAKSILASGIAALSGKYDLVRLETENEAFHTEVVDLLEHGEISFVPVYAGMTCFSALNTVLYDTNFDVVGENEKSTPPDDWDAGYYASLVKSGSAVWEAKGGSDSRRRYWKWYLEYALPQAWEVLAPLA